jgi:hypothetical protein
VEIACELRDVIQARYVFQAVKPALLAAGRTAPFDPRRHLDACVAGERAIAREEDPLRFYDRMRRCTAAFEDGHLILSVPGDLPPVALGVGLRLAGGGTVHVATRAPALVRWLEDEGGVPDAGALLAPGTEVLAIDGVPVRDALAELARHLPASSTAAGLERAVDALTQRDFAYPRAPVARLTVRSAGSRRELALPWWIAPGAERNPLVAAYLRRTPLRSGDLLRWSATPRWATRDPAAGPSRGDPILAPADAALLRDHTGDAGHVAARLGEGKASDGRPFCYAQLLTLHTQTLAAPGAERRPLVATVAEFARGCGARGLDLVLDLRQNEGGYIAHSTALARALARPGAAAARGALLLRANDHNERVFRERAPGAISRLWNGKRSEVEELLAALVDARERGERFTPAFVDAAPAPDAAAFDGRVVALVAPTCMSACERLAALLQGAGAILVGGPTEGAGGSQQEAKGVAARWVDASGRLAVSVPTAAMGVVPAGAGASRTTSAERFFSDLALENRPVVPDVPHATTVDDLTGGNAGWRAAAERALRASAGVAGRGASPVEGGRPRA